MLNDKLKSWTYYKNKLPLYFRNSYGIMEHFDILYQLLKRYDDTEDTILSAFDITSDDYERNIIFAYDTTEEQHSFYFLDILASLYGVSRSFDVEYDLNKEHHKVSLYLTNSELLKLIKCRIIQNNFDGSYKQTREFYDKMRIPVYLLQGPYPATVQVIISTTYSDGTPFEITENEMHMYLANLFTIESMGITYFTSVQDVAKMAIWDSTSKNRAYDSAKIQ